MTFDWQKIEYAATEAMRRESDFQIQRNPASGDICAVAYAFDSNGDPSNVTINVTALAKDIADALQ